MFLLQNFIVYAQINDWDPACMVNGVPTLKCLESVFGNIITISTAFIVLILFIMFIIGGYKYLTSFGNPEKVKKAQATLKFAIAGFGVFLISYLLLKIIGVIFLNDGGAFFDLNLPGP